ncbi:MAG: nitrous oxide-stimulated promoter family protein [Chlorobi bacterium]|nr:nitrous oxide-stimulated promoter family protein [Chlorobiota bacterium]
MKKEKRIKKDAKVLNAFIKVYCKKNHLENGVQIFKDGFCKECYELLQYALKRNENCPLDPKPLCKNCKVHCYKPEYRERIKQIMRFSGIYFIKRGRLDWVWHYFF